VWNVPGFRAYLGTTVFTGIAFSMQQLLVSWLLVGVLLLPGDRVGLAQALIGIPGILFMLWGGASADRIDPRALLSRVYGTAPLVPLALVLAVSTVGLDVWIVTLWGFAMGAVLSFSNPAQAAILNRVTGPSVQQGVSASTAVAFLVQMLGLALAGLLDRVGLEVLVSIQACCLAVAAVAVRRIEAEAPRQSGSARGLARGIAEGIRETLQEPVVASVVSINFLSSIFNAGAFITVFPFIIKRLYDGDASLLALMMIVFFGGATVSNLILFRVMPLRHPGRLFLLMQLSRIPIVGLLWIQPPWWGLVAATILWGLNMGVTATLARTIVQESASPEFRGRILSVFNIALMGSAPLGALLLGWIVEAFGTIDALVPSMAVSGLLFVVGVAATGIWAYRSQRA
jgi:predicted MFS family arabinose efflux permease